jgi:glycosyltransferase involved in cell wall biosynthesis
MEMSVIITTYNAAEWLEKVMWGYQAQVFRDFELVIADDGSNDITRALITRMQKEVFYPVKHVWHEDEGFRKCTILNKAITAAATDYLVISDGDCIPRNDFLQVHATKRKRGYFLSGGYSKLPMELSKQITKEDVLTQRCFDVNWLKKNGLPDSFKNSKFTASGWKAGLLNIITPTNASWNGHNSSAWKQDILNVNGFDERMRYGALDREMGERLMNNGVKGLQIRYSAICIHLDHSRGYKNEKDLANNQAIRDATKKEKRTWTDYGIVKGENLT